MTKIYTKPFHLLRNHINRTSVFLVFLSVGFLHGNLVQADNKLVNGTKIKVVTGTYAVSSGDFVINDGASFTNGGTLLLKKDLSNFNTLSELIGNVTFSGSSPQTIKGSNIIKNLTANNASGIFIEGETAVEGVITFASGTISLGINNLILGTNAVFSGSPSSSNMIVCTGTGELRKRFPYGFTGNFLFPVGDVNAIPEYSPVNLNFTSGDFGSDNFVGITLQNSKYENPLITGNYLNRYWNLSQSDILNFNCDVSFQYTAADVVGDENLILCKRMLPTPILTFGPANVTTHQLTAEDLTSFGTFTGGPQTDPTLTGPTTPCKDVAGNVYTTDAGMTNYQWSVSSGGTVTAGGTPTSHTITITWNTAGPQTVSVTYDEAPSTTVLDVTVIGPIIYGRTDVCKLSTHTYTTQEGMSNYKWSFSGGVLKGGGTTSDNFITIQWTVAGSRYVRVNYTNGNCAATTTLPVTVQFSSPTITGPSKACVGYSYRYRTDQGMTYYQWSCSAGGTILGGGNTYEVYILWNVPGTQYVYCIYNSPYGCVITQTTFKVAVLTVPAPTISGNTNPTQGTTEKYTTQTGMNSYTWSVSSGGIIQGGGGLINNYVDVLWDGVGEQWVSVNYANAARCTAPEPTVLPVNVQGGSGPAGPVSAQNPNEEIRIVSGEGGSMNNEALSEFTIYPIPNDGRFVISISNKKAESYSISIYNSLGAEVYTLKDIQVYGIHKQSVDIYSATEGIYNITVKYGQNQVSRRILIKK